MPAAGVRNDANHMRMMVDDGATDRELMLWNFLLYNQIKRTIWEYRDNITAERDWTMDIRVYWGATGTGKSRRAIYEAKQLGKWAYVHVGRKGDRVWWDNCIMKDTIVIEDFSGEWDLQYLLRVLDRYPMNVEVKGHMTKLVAKTVIFTSNTPPSEWYGDVDYNDSPLKRRMTEFATVVKHTTMWTPPELPEPAPILPLILVAAHLNSDVSLPPTPLEDEQELVDLTDPVLLDYSDSDTIIWAGDSEENI